MAKLGDPTGNGIIYITQTLHGEGSKLPNMQCAVDIRMYANEYFHSPCDGVVKMVSSGLGGYVAITPFGFNGYVLLVHTDRFQVRAGQRVTKGQILGQIANLGANSHLHFGMKWNNAHLPAPNPMDYFDRNIPFRASFQNIAKDWFRGNMNGDIDWSLFRDLSLGSDSMANKFYKGDKVYITGEQRVRKAPGGEIISGTIPGQSAIIYDNPRQAVADGVNYTWYDLHFIGGGSGWVADVGKFRRYNPETDDPKPTPQEVPQTNPQEERIKELEGEVQSLTTANQELSRRCEDTLKELSSLTEAHRASQEALQKCEDSLKETKDMLTTVTIERNRFENEKNEAIRELRELKGKSTEIFWETFRVKMTSLGKGLVNFLKGLADKE